MIECHEQPTRPIPSKHEATNEERHENPRHGSHGLAHPILPTSRPCRSAVVIAQTKREPLRVKRDVLLHRAIQALPVGNVQVCEIVRHFEEHVVLLRYVLEARRVVGESITGVRGARVPQEDAEDLRWVVLVQLWVGFHDVRVGRVPDEDELPVGERLEDLVQQELAYRQRGREIGKVERSRVEGAERVRLVDEVHVVARDLLRRRGEVVEMKILD